MLSHWIPVPDTSEKNMTSEMNAMAEMKDREETILLPEVIELLSMYGTNSRLLVTITGDQMKKKISK